MKIVDWLYKQDVQINQRLHGKLHESISARCWRLRAFQPYKILRPVIDRAFFLAPEHCRRAYEKLQLADPTYDPRP